MRPVALLASSLLVLVLVLGATPAQAYGGGSKRARPAAEHQPGRAPLVIGDSVLLGAVKEVAAAGFEVDSRGCRPFGEGLSLMSARRRAGTLPRLVVVALGSNWIITNRNIEVALDIAGPDRTLVLVAPREPGGDAGADAHVVRVAGRRHPNRIRVLDWVRFSAGRRDWFAPDGLHLGHAGARAYARMLRGVLPLAGTPRRS